jgi:hypothetical protein
MTPRAARHRAATQIRGKNFDKHGGFRNLVHAVAHDVSAVADRDMAEPRRVRVRCRDIVCQRAVAVPEAPSVTTIQSSSETAVQAVLAVTAKLWFVAPSAAEFAPFGIAIPK